MAKKALCIVLTLIMVCSFIPEAAASGIAVGAGSAILMDAETGQVLYDKNIREREYPASITKVLTAILAFEKGSLSDTVTMSEEAVMSVPAGSSNIALQVGEKISLEQAMYAMLLMSSNDAANGIAEHIGGSIDGFVNDMNACAAKLGAAGSHFVNANGLPDDNHYTTAYDMALIMRRAIELPDFLRISQTVTYTMAPTNLQPLSREFAGQHKMMKNTPYYYEGVIAGKTGYTSQAGHTLLTAAESGGRTLICVILNADTVQTLYGDTKTLLDYGFDSLKEITLSKEEINENITSLASDGAEPEAQSVLKALVPSDTEKEDLEYELDKNSVIIKLKDSGMGEAAEIGSVSVISPAKQAAAQATNAAAADVGGAKDNNPSFLSALMFIAAAVIFILAILFAWGFIKSRHRKQRRKRKQLR